MSKAEQWFHEAITRGLQALVVLHLPGGPAYDTVSYTRDVWVKTLWDAPVEWDRNADEKRLETAFNRIARNADRWPAPRQLLEHMPARPQPPALPGPKLSEEQKRRNSEYLRAALREAMNRG